MTALSASMLVGSFQCASSKISHLAGRERGFAVRIIAACALAFMLAGCVAKSPTATDEERNEAMAALNSCLAAAARKLDDGTSEATTPKIAM
jgi:hypothetical protein